MSDPDERPLLLAIETATSHTSAALLRGEDVVDEEQASSDAPAAECLLPAIDVLFARTGTSLEAVRAFAVSVGPGSFTGLRIGVATVKGLAFGSELPVVPVSTLAGLALAAGARAGTVVATLDARRGELYAAGFEASGCARAAALPEGLYGPSELLARLPAACRIVGEADVVAGATLRERLGPDQQLEPAPGQIPRARAVGILGARALARGEWIDAAALVPRYVRRAEAEARRLGRPTEVATE